jgi:hypothetical protein
MKGWLDREITDIQKAAELRIREATGFVTAYALGEITAEDAARLSNKYDERWEAPLPGVFRSRGLSDDEILAKIDEARSSGHVDKLLSERLNPSSSPKKA